MSRDGSDEKGTVTIAPSEITLEKRTSDPSLEVGTIWFRNDLDEYRCVVKYTSFASPRTGPEGVGLDSGDCIWSADGNYAEIYQLDQTGSMVSSFTSPSFVPTGVGLDSADCIWNADDAATKIYQLDQTGSVISSFASPSSSPTGVGLDSTDHIWHADSGASQIYEIDQSGNYGISALTIQAA